MNEKSELARQNVKGTVVPGPEGYPLVGVIPKIGGDPLSFFVDVAQEYGPIVRLELGPAEMYLVSDPDAVQHVLQANYRNYNKGYDTVEPVIGNGLVSSDGQFWLRQRRLMQPMFHRQRIAGFADDMVAVAAEVLDGWREHALNGTPFDLVTEMTKLTQQVIARTMFSADVGEQTDVLMDAFDVALEYMNQSLLNPLPFIQQLPTPTNIRFRGALKTLNEITYEMIASRRALLQEQPDAAPDDLLTMLLQARVEETGEGMSDQQIRDEVVTIFFAGHETTASTLSWAWYVISQRGDVAEKLYEEVQEQLEGRRPGIEDVSQLPYVRQVIDESLRLFPPAWMFARQAIDDDEICGYRIPAGSTIMLSPYVTHRDPSFWEQPYRFDPARFDPKNEEKRHRFAYFPFGGGPRLCIGKDFALTEAVLVSAMIAQQYRLTMEPGAKVKAQPVATLRPRPSVMVTATRI